MGGSREETRRDHVIDCLTVVFQLCLLLSSAFLSVLVIVRGANQPTQLRYKFVCEDEVGA